MPPYDPELAARLKALLSNPELFPDEFKSYLRGELTSASFTRDQLPKDLQPPTLVAKIGDARNPWDGQRVRLRLGSTPFEFIELTYDGTYKKFVSAALPLMGSGDSPSGASWTHTFAGAGAFSVASFYAGGLSDAVDAGLTLQFRITGTFRTSHAATPGTISMEVGHLNVGEAVVANTFQSGFAAVTSGVNNIYTGKDSGWVTATNPGTPKTIWAVIVNLSTTVAASVDFVGGVRYRWVST